MLQSSVVEIASAPTVAFSEKDWEAARAALTPDFVYDEVATERRVEGADQVLEVWKGWAEAFPDSRATINVEHVSGDTVVLGDRVRSMRHYFDMATMLRQLGVGS